MAHDCIIKRTVVKVLNWKWEGWNRGNPLFGVFGRELCHLLVFSERISKTVSLLSLGIKLNWDHIFWNTLQPAAAGHTLTFHGGGGQLEIPVLFRKGVLFRNMGLASSAPASDVCIYLGRWQEIWPAGKGLLGPWLVSNEKLPFCIWFPHLIDSPSFSLGTFISCADNPLSTARKTGIGNGS